MKRIDMLFLTAFLFILDSFAYEELLDNFKLTGYDEHNQKKWELQGKDAHIQSKDISITSVRAKVYEKKQVINIKADKGYIDKEKMAVALKENVILKNSQGASLYTQVLNWDQRKEILWTDAVLSLVKGGNEITGQGGKLQTDLSHAWVEKDVRFEAVPQTIITSDGPLEVDYLKNVAKFNKNVHVVDRRGEIFSDTLVVYFDPEKKKITRVHASGNVRLKRGNSWSYSQEAIYDLKSGVVKLLGKPKLEIYPE